MSQFDQLVESRRQWIDEVLEPWCRKATLRDLRRAELEWVDIAGKVAPEGTLWTWAWSRFDALVNERISGVDETHPVTVSLADGSAFTGYPDARRSERGELVLIGDQTEFGPVSIDDIVNVQRAAVAT